jgi:protein-disulfide isomerase
VPRGVPARVAQACGGDWEGVSAPYNETPMMSKVLERIGTPLLVGCCLTVTALSIRRQFFPPPPPEPARPTQAAKGRPIPAVASREEQGPRLGPPDAPLRLVEFADFECPFCAVAAGEIREIRQRYPGAVSISFRHLPIHAHAREAALAAECAAEQGAFENYYYALFQNYAKLGSGKWRKLAEQAHVNDLDRFETCLRSERYAGRIDADTAAASSFGVGSTPTWIVGDSVYGGVPSMSQLDRWVTEATARRDATMPARANR